MRIYLSETAHAVVYYLLALILAIAVALANGSTTVYMFTPLVAVLVMQLLVTRDGFTYRGWKELGLQWSGSRQWVFALLAPALVMTVAYGIVFMTGIAQVQIPDRLVNIHPVLILPLLLVDIVVATFTTSLGEELGWRGYLLPRLGALGPKVAMACSGFLHALWHLPLILLTSNYHAEGNRLVVLPLFVLCLTLSGFLLGYLRLTTDSVWPASLAHSAHNGFWHVFALSTTGASPLLLEYLVGDTGILISIGYAAITCWILSRNKEHFTRQ
jgi:membrane protease YdiL (CAAX protease family)